MKIACIALCLAPLVAAAQSPSPAPSAAASASPSPSILPMWRCDLPGGTYEVALRSILAISTHEYVVDGVARVTELNIATPGDVEARFYFIAPSPVNSSLNIGQAALDHAKELADEVAGQVAPGEQPPWEKVVKNYPVTTHAHTVEYRLDTKDDIQSLFNSVDQAFRNNQNTEIRLQ
jgi:hypothetical protein